jgi:hypothetical protein
MEIAFSHRLTWASYKKWLISAYYFNHKKRLYGYPLMMLAGLVVIVFKLTNAFQLSDRYPEETLYIVGGSLIVTPLFFYRGVIQSNKKYFHANPVIAGDVNYVFDQEKISYETNDGNTGACKWKNVKTIIQDQEFIRIILQDDTAFLIVKEALDKDKLMALQQLMNQVKE